MIWLCCAAVKLTPTRVSAVRPLTGSFKALPTRTALRAHVLAHRDTEVERRLGGLVEYVVAFAGLVPDVAEREQHVLAGLDDLVIDAGLLEQRAGELVDVLRGDVRGAARRLQHRRGLRGDLRVIGELFDAGVQRVDERAEPGGAGRGERDLAEILELAAGRLARGFGLREPFLEVVDLRDELDDDLRVRHLRPALV